MWVICISDVLSLLLFQSFSMATWSCKELMVQDYKNKSKYVREGSISYTKLIGFFPAKLVGAVLTLNKGESVGNFSNFH